MTKAPRTTTSMPTWVHGKIAVRQVLAVQNEIRQGRGKAARKFVERRAVEADTVLRPEFLNGGYPDRARVRQAQERGQLVLV